MRERGGARAPRGERVYKSGPNAGKRHGSGRHREDRKGFGWKADFDGMEPVPVGESRLCWVEGVAKRHLRIVPGDFLG